MNMKDKNTEKKDMTDEDIENLLSLSFRSLKDEYQEHLSQSAIDFPATEKLLAKKITYHCPATCNENQIKIVLTNRKGPRAKLFYQLFGKSTELKFEPYKKDKQDFMPLEYDCKSESQDIILVNTAFQRGIEYIKNDYSKKQNELIISQITRMFLAGNRVEKAKKKMEAANFYKLFNNSQSTGIEVTTGISIIHCGRYVSNDDIKIMVAIVKRNGGFVDKKDIKDYLLDKKIIDSNMRIRINHSELNKKIDEDEDEEENKEKAKNLPDNVKNVIRSKINNIFLSKDFYKVKLGYGKSYLYLKNTDTELSIEECEIIMELICNYPLEYLNLLELYYFKDSKSKMVKDLLDKEEKIIFKDLFSKITKNDTGYGDYSDINECSRQTGIDIDKLEKLVKNIKKNCSIIEPVSLKNAGQNTKSILASYLKWNKHVGRTGGLRIQDRDLFICVYKLEGDPFSIVGLPIEPVFKFLNELDIEIDISTLYKLYWPNRTEFQKILNENQKNLLNRKNREHETFKLIKKYGELKDYGWQLRPDVKAMEGLTLIKLALSTNDLPLIKNQIKNLRTILENAENLDDFKDMLLDISNELRNYTDMHDLSNSKKIIIARKIDDLGNIIYNDTIEINRYRNLEDEVINQLSKLDNFKLQFDPECRYLEKLHYSTINIPEIEYGIIYFNNFLTGLDDNIKNLLTGELKPPELKKLKIGDITGEGKNNYWEMLLKDYRIIVRELLDSIFNSIHDAFDTIIKANELIHEHLQISDKYIVNDWEHFKYYIEKEIIETSVINSNTDIKNKKEKSTIVICLGNNGIETMMSLWISYLLLRLEFNVYIVVKSGPSMIHDCTGTDLEFVIPYFEYLIKKNVGNNKWGYLKPLLYYENNNLNKFEIIKANNKEELEKKLEPRLEINNNVPGNDLKKIFTLFIGEVWYTEIVGLDELNIPPYILFKDKNNIKSTAYSLHVHKSRKKPLAIMNQNIFTRKGVFISPELTTGWYVSQIFRPKDDDGKGWRYEKQSYNLEYSENQELSINLIKLISDHKDEFKNQLLKDCRAYAGLPEVDTRVFENHIDNKLKFIYKSPHKFVIVTVEDNSTMSIEIYMEYENARIPRTGGTEWESIKNKIPRLIVSIFTGLIFKYNRDRITGNNLFIFESIKLVRCDEINDEEIDIEIKFNSTDPPGKELDFSGNYYYEIKIEKDYLKDIIDDKILNNPDFKTNILYTKVNIYLENTEKSPYERRTRIYPARYDNNTGHMRIRIQFNKSSIKTLLPIIQCIEIISIALFNWEKDTAVLIKSDFKSPVTISKKEFKKEDLKNINFENKTLDINEIRNAGAIAGPVDRLTTCNKRVDLAKNQKIKGFKKPIAFTELIRIGSIFLDTDIYYQDYWSAHNYLSGLPRLETSSEEGPVIFQLAGPHNLPFGAPDWIFPEADEKNSSIVKIFSASAQLAVFAGAAGIDINMCCTPLHSQGGGTKLLEGKEDRELAYSIAENVRKSIGNNIPLSCKARLIQKEDTGAFVVDEKESAEFYWNLFKQGVDWIIVETRIEKDGQGLLNDNTARSKRESLKNIIDQIKKTDNDIMNSHFFFINGEILHKIKDEKYNYNIDDFKAIKSTGCEGAVISMGLRVDITLLNRCRQYLKDSDADKKFYDSFIVELDKKWDEIKNNETAFKHYIASIIRGHDCANCDYRRVCNEKNRCIPIAAKIWNECYKKFPDSSISDYIMKRLSYKRREKFKLLWEKILTEKSQLEKIHL